jgi:TonB family protein
MPLKAHLRTTTLLLALTATAPLLAQSFLPARWRADLKQADKQLRAQQWQDAGKKARRVVNEMVDNVGTRIEAAHSLAVATAVVAIAEAGLGHTDEAEWLWDSALNLDPTIARADVSGYGPAAAELSKRSLRTKAKEEEGTLEEHKEVEAPRIIHQTKPDYPEALRRLGVGGDVVVSVIIETDGRPRQPLIVDAHEGGPALKYLALDTLRQWRFEPAKLDGKPVRVYYVLTVNFRVRN